ncbi:MAG TPA: AAA family ATPase, partial [Candidatus Limnocylindria bacterium]
MDRLVGRDAELAVGVAWLDNPTDLPSTIIIEGDPGAGKTALFGAVVALARERSYRVLEAAPAEPEAGLAYATLLDLIGPVAGEAMAALSSPQRSALEVALLLKPAEDVPPDRLAIGVACRGAIESLAAGAPLMVAIDDAQWIDEATSEALRFALRRIAGAPVAVLCARRTGLAAARRLGAGLPAPRTVALAPLSVGAIHAIIQAQTGITLDRPRLLRLHELSGGNPFYAIELARAYGSGSLRLAAGEPLPPDLESLV